MKLFTYGFLYFQFNELDNYPMRIDSIILDKGDWEFHLPISHQAIQLNYDTTKSHKWKMHNWGTMQTIISTCPAFQPHIPCPHGGCQHNPQAPTALPRSPALLVPRLPFPSYLENASWDRMAVSGRAHGCTWGQVADYSSFAYLFGCFGTACQALTSPCFVACHHPLTATRIDLSRRLPKLHSLSAASWLSLSFGAFFRCCCCCCLSLH